MKNNFLRPALTLLVLIIFFLSSFAEASGDKKDNWNLVLSDLSSPFSTNSRYILLGGSALAFIALMNREALNKNISNNVRKNKPLGTKAGKIGEFIGWGFLNAFYVLGFGIHGQLYDDKLSKERAEIMLMSSFYTTGTTTILKTLIHEKRPYSDQERDSFPSGHASAAFNFSTVVMMEHGPLWGTLAHTLAAFIAFSRLHDGKHWPSDIIAGAALGSSYGLGVYLNRRNENKNFLFSFVPNIEAKDYQLKLSYKF